MSASAFVRRATQGVVETLFYDQPRKVTVAVARLSNKFSFALQRGGVLPPGSLHVKFASYGDESLPTVLLCPSMSNTPFVVDVPELGQIGWWKRVVGEGAGFGIRLDRYRVVVPSPLGSPHGSTSPLSFKPGTADRFGPDFPVVTPADMADVNAWLLDELGIDRVHAVIGGSMGGMQVGGLVASLASGGLRWGARAGSSPFAVAVVLAPVLVPILALLLVLGAASGGGAGSE
jgi:homoserine acetyltransferase